MMTKRNSFGYGQLSYIMSNIRVIGAFPTINKIESSSYVIYIANTYL